MQAHEHFVEGQKNLAQAATAQTPDRLIGMAQAHFLAAQTLLQAHTIATEYDMPADHEAAWDAAAAQQFGPNGKPA